MAHNIMLTYLPTYLGREIGTRMKIKIEMIIKFKCGVQVWMIFDHESKKNCCTYHRSSLLFMHKYHKCPTKVLNKDMIYGGRQRVSMKSVMNE